MQESPRPAFEQALVRTEREADTALKAATRVVKDLKGIKQAAQQGDVRKLRATADTVQQSMGLLDQAVSNTATSWDFDEEGYLREGGYTEELLAEAGARGLTITQQDERLYSYPVLMTIDPARRAVLIDKVPERRLRPGVLVDLLLRRQRRPPSFKAAAFLESLYAAYKVSIERRKGELHMGSVVQLLDLYRLFTLMVDQEKEYPRPEFTRDLYLLDQSGVAATRDGATMALHASTGTKSGRGVLSIVGENGEEKRYYGISFSSPGT